MSVCFSHLLIPFSCHIHTVFHIFGESVGQIQKNAEMVPKSVSLFSSCTNHYTMNKRVFTLLFSLFILSVASAAASKPFYFDLYKELHRSWRVTKSVLSISTGAIVEQPSVTMFNVTKNDIPQELVLEEVALDTMEEIRKPYQFIVSVSSNFTATVNRFEPGAEEEIQKMIDINLREFLHEEVYVSEPYECKW